LGTNLVPVEMQRVLTALNIFSADGTKVAGGNIDIQIINTFYLIKYRQD
jgi:hypothetical protein